jgi:pilus assembly protein CpaE
MKSMLGGKMQRELAVMMVDVGEELCEELSRKFERLDFAELLPEVQSPDNAHEAISETEADVLVIELDSSGDTNAKLKWVETVKMTFPELAVFVSSTDSSPKLLMAAMRAGVQEFLSRPLDDNQFVEAFERVHRMRLDNDKHRGRRAGSVVSFFSIKGGMGVTTLSVNTGVALSTLTEQEAAIVDLDFQLGDVANYLDLKPDYNILDACNNGRPVDARQLQSCMTRYDSNLFVLAEPERLADSAAVERSDVEQILKYLKSMYSFVIVDAPHALDERTLGALGASDHIVLVAVADISSIRATQKSLDFFRSLGCGPGRVKLLINRVSKKDEIKQSEIEATLGYPVTWTVPNDYKDVIESINSGIPLAGRKRLSGVGKSIQKLAADVQNWVQEPRAKFEA